MKAKIQWGGQQSRGMTKRQKAAKGRATSQKSARAKANKRGMTEEMGPRETGQQE
jgi:hypothetical protein